MPRDKDMLATFVHALAFFPCNSPRQGSFMPWLFFLAIPRDKVRSCLGFFSLQFPATRFVHALAFFPCNSPRQGHVGNVRSCLRRFFSPFLPKPLPKSREREMRVGGKGRDESERRRAESQWIVAARPLCHLQYPVAYLSRLQRILPAAR
jgi:hypothetical protein